MGFVGAKLEYQKRWEYVVQSEERRDRAARWYFIVVGTLLSVAYTGELDIAPGVGRPAILFFLTLYSLATILYLVGLKLSYREHVDRIRVLDAVDTEHRDEGWGAYSFFIYALGLVGSFLACATVVAVQGSTADDALSLREASDGIAWGAVFFLFVLAYNLVRLSRDPDRT